MRDSTLIRAVRQISYAFFPRRCSLCGTAVPPDEELCEQCSGNTEYVEEKVCKICGRGKKNCVCVGRRVFYESAAAPFYYSGAVKNSIGGLKFRKEAQNADGLALHMAKCVSESFSEISFDAVTCVPLSKSALKRRGYNQSALLAKAVAKILSVKFEEEMLCRTFQSMEQKNLSAGRRFGAVFGSFDCADSDIIKDKTILLCDDVSTTCATLNECAKMLLLSGAKAVYCVTAAVTKKEVKQCSEQTSV